MVDRATVAAWDAAHVWHPFTQAQTAPAPLPIAQAQGAYLTDYDGKDYLDLISSWWVILHGHSHPAIAEAIARQAREMAHIIFAGHTHAPAAELAHRLAGHLPGGLNRVFYSDDGSTAVEVALKAALQYCRNTGDTQRTRFVAFDGGYHGDTVGSMSLGRSSHFFDAFSELMFPVDVLPMAASWDGDPNVEAREAEALAALDRHLTAYGHETVAAIIEPLLQGAGGMQMHRPAFLRGVVERLQAHGVQVIFDEVATGFARTGAMFACTKAGVEPDYICLSKGLTSGFLPMAVTVCQDRIYEAFLGETVDRAFLHGHSFTANPLGCAAALASLDLLEGDEAQAQQQTIVAAHKRHLPELARMDQLIRPRQLGTVAAIDVDDGGQRSYRAQVGKWLKADFMAKGFAIRPLGNTIYLLPPLCVTEGELAQAYAAIEESVQRFFAEGSG